MNILGMRRQCEKYVIYCIIDVVFLFSIKNNKKEIETKGDDITTKKKNRKIVFSI